MIKDKHQETWPPSTCCPGLFSSDIVPSPSTATEKTEPKNKQRQDVSFADAQEVYVAACIGFPLQRASIWNTQTRTWLSAKELGRGRGGKMPTPSSILFTQAKANHQAYHYLSDFPPSPELHLLCLQRLHLSHSKRDGETWLSRRSDCICPGCILNHKETA